MIHGTELSGRSVLVDIDADAFVLAMLEKYLQVNHPSASVAKQQLGYYDYVKNITKVTITFKNESEAMAFHLRYHT